MQSVLIVDDNPQVRRLLRTLVEGTSESYVCGEAIDGIDAIQKAKEVKPDVVILDFSMPRLNGLEVAKVLRAAASEVRIFLFTCYADAIEALEASAAGINAVFSKTDVMGLLTQVKNVPRSV